LLPLVKASSLPIEGDSEFFQFRDRFFDPFSLVKGASVKIFDRFNTLAHKSYAVFCVFISE
jgi:hypothetical protein